VPQSNLQLGKHIYVGLPDTVARETIARNSFKDVPLADDIFQAISNFMPTVSAEDIAKFDDWRGLSNIKT